MKVLKDDVADMIRGLPKDASLEDIQYHLYVLEKLRRGQQELRNGQGLTHDQARSHLAKWFTD